MRKRNFFAFFIIPFLPFLMAPSCSRARGSIDQVGITSWTDDDICLNGFIELKEPWLNDGVAGGPVVIGPVTWTDGEEYDYYMLDNEPYLINITTGVIYPVEIDAGPDYEPDYIVDTYKGVLYGYQWFSCGIELKPKAVNTIILRSMEFTPNPQDPNYASWNDRRMSTYTTSIDQNTIVVPVTVHLLKSQFPDKYGRYSFGVDFKPHEAKLLFDNQRTIEGSCVTQYTVGRQCPYKDIAPGDSLVDYITINDYLWHQCGIQFRAVQVLEDDPYDYYVSLGISGWSPEKIELNARMKSICLSSNWGIDSTDRECLGTIRRLNDYFGVPDTINVFFAKGALKTCKCDEYEGRCLHFCDELGLSRQDDDCLSICNEYKGSYSCGPFIRGNFSGVAFGDSDFVALIMKESMGGYTSWILPHELGHTLELGHPPCSEYRNLMQAGPAACPDDPIAPTNEKILESWQCDIVRSSVPSTDFAL